MFTNMLYTMSDYASEVGRQRSISYPEHSQTKQHAFFTMPVGRLDMYLLWDLLASICLKLFFKDAGKLKNYRAPFQQLLSPLGHLKIIVLLKRKIKFHEIHFKSNDIRYHIFVNLLFLNLKHHRTKILG